MNAHAPKRLVVLIVSAPFFLAAGEASGQGLRGIPVHGRAIRWAETPVGRAAQVGIALGLVVVAIWLNAAVHGRLRSRRRSRLDDLDGPDRAPEFWQGEGRDEGP